MLTALRRYHRGHGGGMDPVWGELSKTYRIRISEAALVEVAQKAQRGELVPESLKQLALAGLASVLAHPRARYRELIRSAAVVQKWLEAEADKGQGNVVVAVQIIQEVASKPAIIESNGHKALPRFEANGVEFRRDSGHGEGA